MTERREEDPLVADEEQAAAAEAGRIGGPDPQPVGEDPAARPVEEGGGGEAEGFEQAEQELTRQASHDDAPSSPMADAFTPESEADPSAGEYGEPDEVDPTEVTSDPESGPDDPGEGPGIATER